MHDPEVQVLLATDAAGEGINLQRAHLMVNYDLPWNPNRLEQRFGRIHRIGQTEVCHLWNLVAEETREGEVYRKLLEKLEAGAPGARRPGLRRARQAPVRGPAAARAADRGDPLRRPARGARPPDAVSSSTRSTASQLQDLLEERALAHDAMDASRVHRIREDMERAEARRLQPHYIESFFLEAFQRLGGTVQAARAAPLRDHPRPGAGAQPRPPDRHRRAGAAALRAHRLREGADRAAGPAAGRLRLPGPSAARRGHRPHARAPPRPPQARHGAGGRARPGHAAARALLSRARDPGREPHPLGRAPRRSRKRMLYVELDADGDARHLHYAPYLDYRPLADGEPGVDAILDRPECAWIDRELEQKAQGYAIAQVVPEHLDEVRDAQARADRQDRGRGEGPADQGDHLLGSPRRAAQAPGAGRQAQRPAQLAARPASAPTTSRRGCRSGWRS